MGEEEVFYGTINVYERINESSTFVVIVCDNRRSDFI